MKLGVQKKKIKICVGRTVFRKSTPNLTITSSKFGSNFEVFWNFFKKPLKVPSLARFVPKPLKVPSLARSVQKPLKVPSLARSVPKPLKVTSLARSVLKPLKVPRLARSVPKPLKVPSLVRSVPKPCVGEARELQTRHYHRCRPPTNLLSLVGYMDTCRINPRS